MSKKTSDEGVASSLILRNKKAFHDYEVIETIECGIVLTGTEVKSLRNRNVNFAQPFAFVQGDVLQLVGVHISPYEQGNRENHDPDRKRRLLAHRREIRRLAEKAGPRGHTLVPLKLYWKRGLCKVELGIVRGKGAPDKRHAKREKDMDRQIQRDIRHRR